MKLFYQIIKREIFRLASDKIYIFSMILGPVFCCVFFTTLMWNGLPVNLPLGVVDQDNTATTRKMIRNLDAFQQTAVIAHFPNVTEARRAVQENEIYGFYYIPKGTTKKIYNRTQPVVSYYADFTYLVAGSLLSRDMRMLSELSSGKAMMNVLLMKGMSNKQALTFLRPIVIDTHPISNPWLNYNVYLSNVVLPGVLGLFILMITVYGIGSEIKKGTARKWIAMAKGNITIALLGKILPQTIILFLVGCLFDVYLYGFMHFPCHGGVLTMILVMFLYIIACQGLAIFFISLLPSLRYALSATSLWGVISFSISGMSFPVMSMDSWLQGLSWLFPLRHYFLLYVNSALDGYSLYNDMPQILSLLCFALLPLPFIGLLKKNIFTVNYVP